jgi:HNH endonuclease/NUMOD4 motif
MEEWKDSSHENYEVSNQGRVRNRSTGRIMKPYLDPHGYYSLRLCNNKVYTKKYLHRLIAEAFIENPENLKVVDHINRDRVDNRLENLRWASYTGNMLNTSRHEQEMYGISWCANRNNYQVHFKRNNKQKGFGNYTTLEEAKARRDAVIIQINNGEFLT